MYIVVAILAFGILIATHELGHFAVAKACGVKVNEFAIGMGPVLLKKQGKETQYSLRALPIGGFCAMEGEDDDTGDPRAFTVQPVWKRFLILIAGSAMNFLMGLIVVILLFSQATAFGGTEIVAIQPEFKHGGENGLMVGDVIEKIDGNTIFYSDDFTTYMARSTDGTVDMVITRDGRRITLENYGLATDEFTIDGQKVTKYGVSFNYIEATAGQKLKYSLYSSYNFVRYVAMGLTDLVTGAVGLKDMSGVVGIVSAINDVGEQSDTTGDALMNIAYFCAFIAVNLAVMNMLPIPALDGGRVFFLIITWLIEKIVRRKINPRYEGYIHTAGLVLLLGLMAVVMFNDIVRLVNG